MTLTILELLAKWFYKKRTTWPIRLGGFYIKKPMLSHGPPLISE